MIMIMIMIMIIMISIIIIIIIIISITITVTMIVIIIIIIIMIISLTRPPGLELDHWDRQASRFIQGGVQWKQGVVVLYTCLPYNTTPIHCTPLPLHPPVMNTQASVGVVLGGSTAVQLHPPAAARALKRLGLQAAQV